MISVVIPLYNKEHTIENTLSCVLRQTYQEFEIIIVNDGSTDNSVGLIHEKFNDPRIKVVSQPNQGVSVARNTGIAHANGEWISFLDADDLWSEQYLEYVNKAISKFPDSRYILGGRRVLNVTDNSSFSFIPASLHGRIEKIDFFQNPHIYAHISASTFNRNFLKERKLKFIPGQKFHEDFTFIFQAALQTSVSYIGLPLVTYCGGVAGQSTSNLNQAVRIKDGCIFRNTVMSKWLQTQKEDKLFPVFMRYETRHVILSNLRSNDFSAVTSMLDGLTAEYKNRLFHRFEIALYASKHVSRLSIAWINFTKLLWRMHRFPRVNTK